jgi:hypothetical protein
MLWLLSIRSLITATAEGLEASSIFQQLNLALVTSSLLATVVAITKFLTKGVVEVAVPATLVLASAATTLVATRVWFDAITTTHHLRSPNMALSATDQGVMAFLEGLSSSLSTFLSPRRIDGLCYRFIALLFALQAALALLHPAALLSLLHLSPPFVDRQDVAMAAWAPALLFQACAAFALACQGPSKPHAPQPTTHNPTTEPFALACEGTSRLAQFASRKGDSRLRVPSPSDLSGLWGFGVWGSGECRGRLVLSLGCLKRARLMALPLPFALAPSLALPLPLANPQAASEHNRESVRRR